MKIISYLFLPWSLDAQLFHAGTEGGGMDIHAGRSAVLSLDDPAGFLEDLQNMGAFNLAKGYWLRVDLNRT